MNRDEKKAAIAAYKERLPAWGVVAVICSASGETWVGPSRHVDTQKNGVWFTLRQGKSLNASLQATWTQHGEQAFRFEELERLPADFPEFGRKDEVERRAHLWRARLNAAVL